MSSCIVLVCERFGAHGRCRAKDGGGIAMDAGLARKIIKLRETELQELRGAASGEAFLGMLNAMPRYKRARHLSLNKIAESAELTVTAYPESLRCVVSTTDSGLAACFAGVVDAVRDAVAGSLFDDIGVCLGMFCGVVLKASALPDTVVFGHVVATGSRDEAVASTDGLGDCAHASLFAVPPGVAYFPGEFAAFAAVMARELGFDIAVGGAGVVATSVKDTPLHGRLLAALREELHAAGFRVGGRDKRGRLALSWTPAAANGAIMFFITDGRSDAQHEALARSVQSWSQRFLRNRFSCTAGVGLKATARVRSVHAALCGAFGEDVARAWRDRSTAGMASEHAFAHAVVHEREFAAYATPKSNSGVLRAMGFVDSATTASLLAGADRAPLSVPLCHSLADAFLSSLFAETWWRPSIFDGMCPGMHKDTSTTYWVRNGGTVHLRCFGGGRRRRRGRRGR
jgi:hypothetical protein